MREIVDAAPVNFPQLSAASNQSPSQHSEKADAVIQAIEEHDKDNCKTSVTFNINVNVNVYAPPFKWLCRGSSSPKTSQKRRLWKVLRSTK